MTTRLVLYNTGPKFGFTEWLLEEDAATLVASGDATDVTDQNPQLIPPDDGASIVGNGAQPASPIEVQPGE